MTILSDDDDDDDFENESITNVASSQLKHKKESRVSSMKNHLDAEKENYSSPQKTLRNYFNTKNNQKSGGRVVSIDDSPEMYIKPEPSWGEMPTKKISKGEIISLLDSDDEAALPNKSKRRRIHS